MKANEVIITGRKRRRAPSVAASSSGTPCSRCSLANSTIRMPFLAARPISTTMPIWRVEIERQTAEHDRREGAEHADRDRQQHRHRDGPALVERDQEQVGEQHREAEDDRGLALGALLLERGVGPFAGIARRQRPRRDRLHRGERLAGRDARRRRALHRHGAQVVVADERRRADDDARPRPGCAAGSSCPRRCAR